MEIPKRQDRKAQKGAADKTETMADGAAGLKKTKRRGKGAGATGRPKAKRPKPARPERIRLDAREVRKSLDAIERARHAIEGHFREAAESNLSRARDALGTLARAARDGPLLDVRRLEKDLALLVEASGELCGQKVRGRKRDMLAVDGLLGDAARRLEGAVAAATAHNLGLLSERLTDMEAMRRELQGKVNARFSARLDRARSVLAAVEKAGASLPAEGQKAVARELDTIRALGRKAHPGMLGGKAQDLYTIDRFLKQAARRLEKVAAIMDAGTKHSGA